MSQMQKKDSRRKTILSTLPFQHWIMGAWGKFWGLFKKNTNVEVKYGRFHFLRTFNQAVVNLWNTVYERSKMERVLQSGTRGKKTEGSRETKETTFEGGVKELVKKKNEEEPST